MMTDLERKIRARCEEYAEKFAKELVYDTAVYLGYSPDSTWGVSQEFLQAISPLKEHAKELVAQRAYSKVWNEAYAAAMSVLDERLKND